MKPKKTFIIVILCLALFTAYSSLKHIFNLENSTYDVRIINGFSDNSSLPLVVWCVSQEWGDIGGRALQERDDYSWIVKTKGFFWSSYRFVCTMKWDSRRKKFEAFHAGRDKYRCGANRQCFWLVKEDGFYFSNNGVDWIKDFSWV